MKSNYYESLMFKHSRQITSLIRRHYYWSEQFKLIVEIDDVIAEEWTPDNTIIIRIMQKVEWTAFNNRTIKKFKFFQLEKDKSGTAFISAIAKNKEVKEGMKIASKFLHDTWDVLDKEPIW